MVSKIDFAIAVGIFFSFMAFLYVILTSYLTSFVGLVSTSELRTVAFDIYTTLFGGGGIPADWEERAFTPVKVGLVTDLYRIPVVVDEGFGWSRSNEPLDVYLALDSGCERKAWNSSLRVYEGNEEIDSFIFNQSYCFDGFLREAGLVWKVNISASQRKVYWIYYSPDKGINESTYPSPDFVGIWHFDEGAGSTAYDSSGYGNDGSLVNGPGWVDGRYEKALSFDGVDDYVEVPDSASISLTADASFEAWINMAELKNYHTVIVKENATQFSNYGIFINGTGWVVFQFKNSAGTWKQHWANAGLSANQWHHIVVVMSDTDDRVRIYANGNEVLSEAETDSMVDWPNEFLRIGWRKGEVAGQQFNGTIDEVRIYNRAMTAEEVAVHYNSGPLSSEPFPEEELTALSVSKLQALRNLSYEEVVRTLGTQYKFNIEISEE